MKELIERGHGISQSTMNAVAADILERRDAQALTAVERLDEFLKNGDGILRLSDVALLGAMRRTQDPRLEGVLASHNLG